MNVEPKQQRSVWYIGFVQTHISDGLENQFEANLWPQTIQQPNKYDLDIGSQELVRKLLSAPWHYHSEWSQFD